jgi:hypothetical protein
MRHADTPLLDFQPPQDMPRNKGQWWPKQPALFAENEVIDCPVPVFGRLPKGFLGRVAEPQLRALRGEMLHVCSGSLRLPWTVDIRPEVKPTLWTDVERVRAIATAALRAYRELEGTK